MDDQSDNGMPNPFADLGMFGSSSTSSTSSSTTESSIFDNIENKNNNNNVSSPSGKGGLNLNDGSHVIQIMNKLRNVGAQMEVDLPTIALCGQQSCGKSSLTEAISGVAMPRSAGTCTRCPTELRLIQINDDNSLWECKVGVRFEYDDINQKPLSRIEESLIGKCNKESDVTELVINAQNKILQRQNLNLKFSRNVITVEIYSNKVINLTIMDMPGLIFATELTEDIQYIELVSELIRDTLKKPNTLIAAVISCKDDMENQIINQLVRTYDPNGLRTIGILTKVDTIEKGLESSWINILENEKYPLKLGYIAVRNPSQTEINNNITYQDARNIETSFFINNMPWNQLNIDIQQRLGATNLVRILSETLGNLIIQQLPKMSIEIERKLSYVEKKLLKLPAAPKHDASALETVFDLLVEFTDQIKTLIRNQDTEFWSDAMTELQKLYDNLENFKPRFSKNKATHYIKNTLNSVKNSISTGINDDNKTKFLYTMDEVVEIKKKNRKRNMSCARTYFVKNSMAKWEDASRHAILATSRVLARHIQSKINHLFQQFAILNGMITDIIQELINDLTNNVMEQAMRLLHREIESEFTLSTGRLHATYQQALEQLSIAFGIDRKDENKYSENEAIMIMANSVAYYDLSFRRYVDVLAMAIEDILFDGICKKLDSSIRTKMNLFKQDNNTAKKWLSENIIVAKKRDELTNQLKRLQSVAKELRLVIPMQSAMDNSTYNIDLSVFNGVAGGAANASNKRHLSQSPTRAGGMYAESDIQLTDFNRSRHESEISKDNNNNNNNGRLSGFRMSSPSISSTTDVGPFQSPDAATDDDKKRKKSKKKGWFGSKA